MGVIVSRFWGGVGVRGRGNDGEGRAEEKGIKCNGNECECVNWYHAMQFIPLTAILSPRWQSVRISSQSVIVNDVPPPPLDEVSRGSRDETAAIEESD